jgi:prefoldin alpha subunit
VINMEPNNEENQMLNYQMSQIQQVLENLNNQINDVAITRDALMSLRNLKGDEEVLFPIANGIFAQGRLSSNTVLKMNVGNNVVVDKTVDEAIEIISNQYVEMEKYREELESQIRLISSREESYKEE